MSRYADLADVQALTPQRRYDAQTTPTIDQVLAACDRRSGELDAILADKGIAAPVTLAASPISFGWLRAACAYGAAMDVESAGFPGQGDQGETPRLAFLRGQWERMLEQLIDGKIGLGDATHVPTSSAAYGGPLARIATGSAWFRRDQAWTGGNGPGSILP